jgi:serine/threonine protein kinase
LIDGKQYCVKSIYKERITCKQLHSLLIQEIEIGRNVKHENICLVVSVYEERRMVHLVMEYIDGDNLLDLLLDSGVLEESKTARIAG